MGNLLGSLYDSFTFTFTLRNNKLNKQNKTPLLTEIETPILKEM